MWIKISIAAALLALLGWSVYKLLSLKRRERPLSRNYREPILNSADIRLSEEDDFDLPKMSDLTEEDNDVILGIKTKLDTALNINKAAAPVEPVEKPKIPTTIAIHLMAPAGQPYMGYELLQALLATGLRYGERNIFHRHEHKSGAGRVLFHLASANSPGTFELTKMGSFSCPGLSFFMQLNDKTDNLAAFEIMMDTANELVNDLGGELWDEQRKSLTMDKITEYRLRIRAYQEAKRVPDFFDQYQET